jgi:hypothetical protein
MKIYLKEKIGNPELFTGRKKELTGYLTWIDRIKREISMSQAILSRRKTGKTALLQRLYNITFDKNDGVIPFYYEIPEGKQWAGEFCQDFYLTFIYQYIAFKTRKPEYVDLSRKREKDFTTAIEIARQEGLDYLIDSLRGVEKLLEEDKIGLLWGAVRDAPLGVATRQNEFIVQIIDEFQFLNSEICRDKAATQIIDDFAAGYMSTAEYKNAPLLVSGSWVGWLFSMLNKMTGRFQKDFLGNLPEDEAVEMVFKYSQLENVPVTEETAYLIAQLSEGNPFYISALFRSKFPEKDLTTEEGLRKTLEFETLDERGDIKNTWMEYIRSALPRINAQHAKNIVLYLCKYKDRQVSRRELLDNLPLSMSDEQLEQRMYALIKADIVNKGQSNFYYRAVQDNIFDKVFRGEYASDIEAFDPRQITNEYKRLFEESQKNYHKLLGKYNQMKGVFAEFLILNKLRTAYRDNDRFRALITNLPEDFQFTEYDSVWSYHGTQVGKRDFQVDIFARAKEGTSLIGEVKNREIKAFSLEEAQQFIEKMNTLKALEQVTHAIGIVFSRHGFTPDAHDFFQEHQIAWSEDARWFE